MASSGKRRRLEGQELLDALDALRDSSAREIMLETGYTHNENYKTDDGGLRELSTFRTEFAKAYLAKHGRIKKLVGNKLLDRIDNTKSITDKKLLPMSIMYTHGTFSFENLLACGYITLDNGRIREEMQQFREQLRKIARELDQEGKLELKEIARLEGRDLLNRIKTFPPETPKDQLIEACGYYSVDNKKKKKDYTAYNRAVVEALREAGLYADNKGVSSGARGAAVEGDSQVTLDDRSYSLPVWAMEDIGDQNRASSSGRVLDAASVAKSNMLENKSKIKLKGFNLVCKALLLYDERIPETSICIRCGYETDDIGQFRRAFSNGADVLFAPLSLMVAEFNASNKQVGFETIIQARNIEKVSIQVRRREAGFREKVFSRHGAKCVCCEIRHPDLLEAAHIVPVANNGTEIWQNGIPLCATHHCAFDKYLFAFEPESLKIIAAQGVSLERIGIKYKELTADVDRQAIAVRHRLFTKATSGAGEAPPP